MTVENDLVERHRVALEKISAIRDSIIGAQTVNWSEHIYPLVAALGEAGFEGAGYEISRANVGTLIENFKAAEARAERAEAELARKTEALRQIIAKDDTGPTIYEAVQFGPYMTSQAVGSSEGQFAAIARSALEEKTDV